MIGIGLPLIRIANLRLIVGYRDTFKKYKVQVRRPEPTTTKRLSRIIYKAGNQEFLKIKEVLKKVIGLN